MCFNQFLQEVSCELHELLWQDMPHPRRGRDLERLEEELHRASAALTQLRVALAEVRERLAEKERRAHWLKTRVEVYLYIADRANAWRYALELDQIQRSVDQERARLQRRRQAYHAQLTRVRRLQEGVDELHLEMYSRR